MDKDRLLAVIEWHGRSGAEREAEQRRAKAKEWNQRRRAARSDARKSPRSDDVTLRRLSRLLLKIVEDAVPLIRCRSRSAKIQAAAADVARRMNISEVGSEDSADMECETNTRHQGSRDCASTCRRV